MDGLITLIIVGILTLPFLAMCFVPFFMRKLNKYQKKHIKEYSTCGRIWRVYEE